MAVKELKHKSLNWVYIDHVNKEAVRHIKTNYSFHPLDIEDIQNENQTPKIDTYKNYLFLVLQFPAWDAESKKVTSFEVDIFIGDGFLVTIQRSRGKLLKDLFFRCLKNKTTQKEWMGNGPGFLLYNIIEQLFQQGRPILNNIGKQIDAVETNIFDEAPDSDVVRDLAVHRHNVLNFRRIIDPQRYLMSNLSHIRKPFLDETMSLYFDDIHDYLSNLWSIVTSFRDTIEGLHVTVESLLTRRTNKVIGVLTVLSVGLLPLTLLAGIYGMNIPLPFSENPVVVWGLFASLGAIILLSIFISRKRGWI